MNKFIEKQICILSPNFFVLVLTGRSKTARVQGTSWRASEERDTIMGVQIRAGAVYIYIYVCMEVRVP